MSTIKGTRPRPRAAIVGKFDTATIENFSRLFPTMWAYKGISDLESIIDPLEIDLLIVSPNYSDQLPRWIEATYTICFSNRVPFLPSAVKQFQIMCNSTTTTEEYKLPELSLGMDRLREVDLAKVENTKGWNKIQVFVPVQGYAIGAKQKAANAIIEGALILDPHTNLPLATIFNREDTNTGIAWLPNPIFRVFPWVEIICTEWAKSDPLCFPNFGNWTKDPKWMLPAEVNLSEQIEQLTTEREKVYRQLTEQIGQLQNTLIETSHNAETSLRLLITAQADELVNEVSRAFQTLGFETQKVDELIPDGSPKVEDLRLKTPSDVNWNAIVEVRGYSKSGGKPDDLLRLNRFAKLFQTETGNPPNKKIYVVNGQTDLLPSQRQTPFSSAPDILEEFAEQDGIVIWSLGLFQLIKHLNKGDLKSIHDSLISAKGIWPSSAL